MHTPIELRDEERTRCEVWTRVMGYHRPISAFNPGKQSEQAERLYFKELKIDQGTRETHPANPYDYNVIAG
ncbi:MAG: anaerobic ribonucleoside-triphosphate reductase [Candidatus Thiodiazotropha sp. (ex Ustalcina ferruginea)]|nr:anaerobic ribonucleoside-triphosphate reductase [Candidatus Thiodiazotropha sp. (ex Ustalcina ferruginea)]